MSLKNYKKPDFSLIEVRAMAAKVFSLVPNVYESSGNDWKVSNRSYYSYQLSNYSPYRYNLLNH